MYRCFFIDIFDGPGVVCCFFCAAEFVIQLIALLFGLRCFFHCAVFGSQQFLVESIGNLLGLFFMNLYIPLGIEGETTCKVGNLVCRKNN